MSFKHLKTLKFPERENLKKSKSRKWGVGSGTLNGGCKRPAPRSMSPGGSPESLQRRLGVDMLIGDTYTLAHIVGKISQNSAVFIDFHELAVHICPAPRAVSPGGPPASLYCLGQASIHSPRI